MTNYEFHSDAGHGWLKVPHSRIPKDMEITDFSYSDGKEYAYLEEDLDAGTFLKSLEEGSYDITFISDGNQSFIRNLGRYRILSCQR